MCTHTAEYRSRTIRGYFNEATVWEDCVVEHALYDLATATTSPSTLDHFLGGLSTQAKRRPNAESRRLDRISRKIVGVLLACSLFQLCGSTWLQHEFEGEKIFILPKDSTTGHLDYWRPHISCVLGPRPGPRSLAEDVAALGVLILELEANLSAGWDDDDEDYDTGVKSNKTRLSRILSQWKGELTDFYHGVGSACFRFENLVEGFDHPKVDHRLRSQAVLYKCIVNPLFQKLVSDFGEAERLFQGRLGLSVPSRQKRASATGHVVLYDDWESSEAGKK